MEQSDGSLFTATVKNRRFASEQSVYGILLVSGMIVVSGAHGETSWGTFTAVVSTVVIFWAAHVYAGAIARHGGIANRGQGMRRALVASARESQGLLEAAVIPCAVLLAGVTRVIPDRMANWAALWVGVALLAYLGYIAFARQGAGPVGRIVGALSTASFGLLMIVLKALVH